MDVTCERCQTDYEFDDALVSEQGTSVRCTQCGHRFKVKRRESGGAPEVWIVRTVDGQALEFRALRELKSAITVGRVGRDDVLSRGTGRPRRLASIAELEPFFTPAPGPPGVVVTNVGLGSDTSMAARGRVFTPSGLGPVRVEASPARAGHGVTHSDPGAPVSVNVPPPTRQEGPHGSAASLAETFEEVTMARQLGRGESREPRRASDPGPPAGGESAERGGAADRNHRTQTRELFMLGESPPPSVEPVTLMEPDRFRADVGPSTIAGAARAPDPPQHNAATRTAAFGTPLHADASAPYARERANELPGSDSERTTARRRHSTPPPVLATSPTPPPVAASASPERQAPAAALDADEPPSTRRAEVLPPEPSAPPLPRVLSGVPTPAPAPAAPASNAEESDAVRPRGGARPRVSLLTPTPPESRYSIAHEEVGDVVPSDRRTSLLASRRSAGSIRLIVVLLFGGALVFLGVLGGQRYLKGRPQQTASADARVDGLLEAGEKALRDGDLAEANDQFVRASERADKDPRVAKALARLAVVRAELPWLELLLLPPNDPGRPSVNRRYLEAASEAQRAVERAELLGVDDPEVARVSLDMKRLRGDVTGARALVARITALEGQPETLLVLAALELSEPKPQWEPVIGRLSTCAGQEGNSGRARALLVYALARSSKTARARSELDELSKLPKAHPLEGALRRFVERAEKGDDVALRIEDLPSLGTATRPAAAAGSSEAPTGGAGTLKVAYEALRRGELAKAEQHFQKVVDGDPNNSEGLSGLATVAQRQGQTGRALGLYKRVVDANPNYAPAVMALADLKWSSGNQAGARPLYRRAVDLGVTGPSAERARERSGGAASSHVEPPATATATATAPTTTAVVPPPPPPPPPPPATSTFDVPPWDGDSSGHGAPGWDRKESSP